MQAVTQKCKSEPRKNCTSEAHLNIPTVGTNKKLTQSFSPLVLLALPRNLQGTLPHLRWQKTYPVLFSTCTIGNKVSYFGTEVLPNASSHPMN